MQRLLPSKIYNSLQNSLEENSVNEIRIRIGKPVKFVKEGQSLELTQNGESIVAQKEDIESILAIASGSSVYAVNDYIIKGYLPYCGGVRIGVCGEGVIERGQVISVKNVSSLCIRIPTQIVGKVPFINTLTRKNLLQNYLIVSPTGCGKTTFLRELTRKASESGISCLIIDERLELTATADGRENLDVGKSSDIVCAMPKVDVYENMIRSMNPQVIVTDEIFGEGEIKAILDLIRCGVNVFASVHAKSIADLRKNSKYLELTKNFENIICLGGVGKIIETERKGEND